MNLNLYGYGPPGAHRWLMIDCGVSFGGDGIPGADVMMADPRSSSNGASSWKGCCLPMRTRTIWAPFHISGRSSAARLCNAVRHRRRCAASSMAAFAGAASIAVPETAGDCIGPFDLGLIGMTHSIPEAQAVAIRTMAAWCCTPRTGSSTPTRWSDRLRRAALRRLGDAGVTALICDSTNVFESGRPVRKGPFSIH